MKKAFLLIACTISIILVLPYAKSYCKKTSNRNLNIVKKPRTILENKPITVVVASYNNEKYFKKNLDSIFSQDYENYNVIYVDDCSKDNTYKLVEAYIQQAGQEKRTSLTRNSVNRGAHYNLFKMIHSINDENIVVTLDGDDWFYNDQVLKNINAYYQNEDVWITYGQYIRYPDDQIGMCKPVSKKFLTNAEFRKHKWQYSHLRTFYAGLFKRISLSDCLYQNKFFEVAYDLAIMYPMLEMAREHAYFIPEVSYVYNYVNPINEAKIWQDKVDKVEKFARNMPKYEKLTCHPKHPAHSLAPDDQSDLVIFSYDRPMQLYACLESIQKYSKNLGQIFVIYRSSNDAFDQGYDLVKSQYCFANFYQQPHKNAEEHFKPLVMKTSFDTNLSKANYIAYCVDDIILTDTLDWQHAITKMQKADAYGFFFRLGRHIDYCYMTDTKHSIPDLIDMQENTFAWVLSSGQEDWNYPNNVDLTLYKKSAIKNDLKSLYFTYPNDMEGGWQKHKKSQLIGLCYENSKMINIPLNVVSKLQNPRNMQSYSPEQLNKMFLSGQKIDINAFYQIKNASAHTPLEPTFIPQKNPNIVSKTQNIN